MHNLDTQRVEMLLSALKTWCGASDRVKGAALVGSWGQIDREHAEADAEIVVIVDDPGRFRTESDWMSEIDWQAAGLGPGHWSDCDYGLACSRHLKFESGEEVEVSFVPPQWASLDPVDPVTRRVAGNGMRVVHDPNGWLGQLLQVL